MATWSMTSRSQATTARVTKYSWTPATARYYTRILKRKPTSQRGAAILKPLMMAQTILKTPVMGQEIRKTPIEEALCRLTTRPLRRFESEGPLVYRNGQGDTLAVPIAHFHRSATSILSPRRWPLPLLIGSSSRARIAVATNPLPTFERAGAFCEYRT